MPESCREIVERLRAMAGPVKPNVCDDAADLIEQMARELADCKASTNHK